MLVDGTGHLTVAVPDTWGDIDLEPDVVDGAVIPQINAATDLDVWRETFDAPGVLYAAYPYTPDEEALYRDHVEPRSGCSGEEVVPYDDGAFVGEWRRFTGCGQSQQAELHVVVASPSSEDVTVVVIVQLVGPQDAPLLDIVLQSFNFTPTASWPATTTTAFSTTTSSSTTTSTTLPAGPASTLPVETTHLENNTGVVSVNVPSGWDDVDTIGGVNDNGSYRPTIAAAPSLEDLAAGFGAPGIRVVALPPDTDPTGVIANARKPDDCQSSGATPFDNGQYTGLSEAWAGCAGGTMDVVLVAARPADGSFTLYAQVQDEAGRGQIPMIVDSLGAPGSTAYPPPTSPPASVSASGTVPETLLQGPVQSDAFIVIDSTRQLRVQVPGSWQDVRITPSFNDDAAARPRIVASLHIDTMLDQWEVPGLVFLEFPYVDAATYLANRILGTSGCDDGGVQSFDNGTYQGLLHTWTNCGGTATRLVTVVVSPPDNSTTLSIEVQLPTADDTALRTVLTSFRQL